MVWAAWLRPCSVLIQIYPEHYYPVSFYEVLTSNVSSIPISWWTGSYVGTDEASLAKSKDQATVDFKKHISSRVELRSKEYLPDVTQEIWQSLFEMAKLKRQRCLDS